MLSATDTSLVARDPDVPGLEVLLDADATASTLDRLYPAAAITSVTPRYVRYKRGTGCLVASVVDAGCGAVEIYARAYGTAIDDKLARVERQKSVSSVLGAGTRVEPRAALAFFPFPNDQELVALRELRDEMSRVAMLREALPSEEPLWSAKLEALRYKPERRFVARLSAQDGTAAALKLYSRRDYGTVRNTSDAFTAAASLRVPRLLHRSKTHRLVATEWLDGDSLRNVLTEGRSAKAGCRDVGAALAELHGQKARKVRAQQTPWSHGAALVGAAEAVADVVPELAGRARRLANKLAARFDRRHWRTSGVIHGDLSPDQILVGNETVGIVDFDRVSRGDPRIDLGTFAARLWFDELCGVISPGTAESCNQAMLAGYRAAFDKDVTRRVDRFTAAGLLLIAVEPFRYRHPDSSDMIESVITRAEQLLARTGIRRA